VRGPPSPRSGQPRATPPAAAPARPAEALVYRIELWQAGQRSAVERVIALALNAQLARAIFRAAREEHPERRITLRKGNHIIADSAR
jgi:hypothetical protein